MRYYVEWFDYFLLIVLLLSLVFLLRKLEFRKLLDVVAVVGVLTFTLIISLNVESMVASNNIEKFKDTPKKLDTHALQNLSIDAVATLQGSDLVIQSYVRRDCSKFAEYHLGYCSKLSTYGNSNFKKSTYTHEVVDVTVEVVHE